MKGLKLKISGLLSFFSILVIIGTVIWIIENNNHIIKTQKVYEEMDGFGYTPFSENNRLAKLDEMSNYKLFENLPILDGATAFYPIYASFAEAVYPSTKDYGYFSSIVLCSRTERAYTNLLEGKAELIFCLEPSERQLQQFHDKNINLKLIPIGREAFVFFVNRKNKINNLSVEDIKKIYSGSVNNWDKLNGSNKRIVAYQRPKNSGSQTILEKIMGDIPIKEAPTEKTLDTMGLMIKMVSTYTNFTNAIGYSFMIYSTEMVENNKIKLLYINDIYPSIENIQNNCYPFTENIYAIYNDNENKNENVEPFIEWILSSQGQTLILKTGYTPIINDFEIIEAEKPEGVSVGMTLHGLKEKVPNINNKRRFSTL
jgi:phosphate transport system substrate-binding protein